jgi:ABC-type nitrate/sulfonate/bicarbonate transport system permease component
MNLDLTHEKIILMLVNFVFGTVLLISYYRYVTLGGVSVKELWGGAYSVRKLYTVSMILAALGYLLVVFFAIFKTTNSIKNTKLLSNLTIVQVIIIVVSMVWLPLTIVFIKTGRKPFMMLAILLVLFIVGIAAFKQIKIIQCLTPENNECARMTQKAAIIGGGVFFFHTFFLDFMGWSCGFFK